MQTFGSSAANQVVMKRENDNKENRTNNKKVVQSIQKRNSMPIKKREFQKILLLLPNKIGSMSNC